MSSIQKKTGTGKVKLPQHLVRERVEEREETNEHLFLANQVKEEFLSHMSKVLRSPLNHITELADHMLAGKLGRLTREQKGALATIFEGSSRLRAIVDRILDLCTNDIGMTRFLPERLTVTEPLKKAVERAADAAKKQSINIITRFDDALGEITADKQKLSFVIQELLTNALKFSPRGSQITVCARPVTSKSSGDGERQFIEIGITDQGRGIGKNDLERVFAGFAVSGPVPLENGSLGLGLALVKRFVELHDGRIWVDSSPGEGSTFTLIVPKEGPLPGKNATPRIMIASDDVGYLQMVTHCLKEEGYEVASTTSGLELLTWGTAHPPDLFLLDLPLPEMDGYDVCRRLKCHDTSRNVPVLLVIPAPDSKDQARWMQAGADGFFVKPTAIRDVLSRVRQMITQKLNYEFLKKSYDIAFSQSRTDPLTGLCNLRSFWEDLDRELARARRYNRQCTLAMLDIDWFKQFNDRHGHLQGDEVLKKAAEMLSEHIRTSDIAARYGGEEFIVIMPETGKELALLVGEKLRRAFAEFPFPLEESQPGGSLTISIGIATFPLDADDSRTLVDMADKALYRAKEEGRNRVVPWNGKE